MNVISNDVSDEIIIKKSKFICYLYSINDISDVNKYLNLLRKTYKDANHVCYAYRTLNEEKVSDDKEPSGTAGLPMLDVLKKNNLVNTLAVVIRIFGGIKLGVRGLSRAYRSSLKNALDKTKIIPYKEYIYVTLTTSFDNLKYLNNICKDLDVTCKIYDEEVIYKLKIEKDYLNILSCLINDNIKMEL